jgi:hypothetical protein
MVELYPMRIFDRPSLQALMPLSLRHDGVSRKGKPEGFSHLTLRQIVAF